MQVNHNVTEDDKRPENLTAAHERRQEAENAETVRVRGPQRPADEQQAQAVPVAKAPKANSFTPPVPPKTPGHGHAVGAITTSDIRPKETSFHGSEQPDVTIPRPAGKP